MVEFITDDVGFWWWYDEQLGRHPEPVQEIEVQWTDRQEGVVKMLRQDVRRLERKLIELTNKKENDYFTS